MKYFIGIMPCYKEDANITIPLIYEASMYFDELIVIADGILGFDESMFNDAPPNVSLLFQSERKGIGKAVLKALDYIIKRYNFMQYPNIWVVIFDADGQHPVREVINGMKLVLNTDAPYLAGVRQLKVYPRYKKLGNKVMDFLAFLITGTRLKDVECGLKFIRLDYLIQIIKYLELDFLYSFSVQFNIIWALMYGKPRYFNFLVPYYRNGRTNFLTGISNLLAALKARLKFISINYLTKKSNDLVQKERVGIPLQIHFK
ncbi:MAG: hypothetical protein J7L26_04485 [Candidatus Aminicenantes bacterium]|nr:hypothetical protein [Candidatus Aminicenantes bacterium]